MSTHNWKQTDRQTYSLWGHEWMFRWLAGRLNGQTDWHTVISKRLSKIKLSFLLRLKLFKLFSYSEKKYFYSIHRGKFFCSHNEFIRCSNDLCHWRSSKTRDRWCNDLCMVVNVMDSIVVATIKFFELIVFNTEILPSSKEGLKWKSL